MWMSFAPVLTVPVFTALAAWTDWRTGRIPNWLTGGAAGVALALKLAPPAASLDGSGALLALGSALLGALLTSALPLLLFWKGAIGGGDVKLFCAIGLACPPGLGLVAQTYSFIAALLWAPVVLLHRGLLLRTLAHTMSLVVGWVRPGRSGTAPADAELTWFRLGPAIFLGSTAAVLSCLTRA